VGFMKRHANNQPSGPPGPDYCHAPRDCSLSKTHPSAISMPQVMRAHNGLIFKGIITDEAAWRRRSGLLLTDGLEREKSFSGKGKCRPLLRRRLGRARLVRRRRCMHLAKPLAHCKGDSAGVGVLADRGDVVDRCSFSCQWSHVSPAQARRAISGGRLPRCGRNQSKSSQKMPIM
jgi:hypothetical protein